MGGSSRAGGDLTTLSVSGHGLVEPRAIDLLPGGARRSPRLRALRTLRALRAGSRWTRRVGRPPFALPVPPSFPSAAPASPLTTPLTTPLTPPLTTPLTTPLPPLLPPLPLLPLPAVVRRLARGCPRAPCAVPARPVCPPPLGRLPLARRTALEPETIPALIHCPGRPAAARPAGGSPGGVALRPSVIAQRRPRLLQ